jgi:hypothetical protein
MPRGKLPSLNNPHDEKGAQQCAPYSLGRNWRCDRQSQREALPDEVANKKGNAMLKKTKTDIEFIKNQSLWPMWPVLPVISKKADFNSNEYCGLVWADNKPEVIIGANLIAIGGMPGATWSDKFKSFKRKEYSSFEELLKEWRVD